LYGFLYSRFSRFDVISRPADHHEDNFGNNEDDLENDESVSANVEGDLENDEDDENARNLETIEIFEAKEWEVYLKDIDSERSILTLQDALALPLPLPLASAKWLFEVKQMCFVLGKYLAFYGQVNT
jgi:hypothetical protein